nr:MFS transporter [Subtercola boreus]
MFGVLSYQLGISMVAPVLPAIAAELGAPSGATAGSQALFFLASGVSSLVAVRLSDYRSRRSVFLAVVLVSAVGSLVVAVAPSVTLLLLGRTLEGVSGAVFPLTYLVLRETLTPLVFGSTVGLISAFGGGLFGLDGLAGGAIRDRFGYRPVFAVVAGVGIIALILLWRVLPHATIPRSLRVERFDSLGAVIVSAAIILLNSGLFVLTTATWPPLFGVILLLCTPLLLVLYAQHAQSASTPLVVVRLLTSRSIWPFLITTLAGIAGAFATTSYLVVLLAQDLRGGYGLNSFDTALFFLIPPAVLALALAPVSGRLAPRLGWILLLRVGLMGSAIALAAAALAPNMTLRILAICGLGVCFSGVVLPMINGLSVLLSPVSAPGLLPALNGVSVGVGGSLGVALVAPLTAQGSTEGYSEAFWVCAGLLVAAFVASAALSMNPPALVPARGVYDSQRGSVK